MIGKVYFAPLEIETIHQSRLQGTKYIDKLTVSFYRTANCARKSYIGTTKMPAV